MINPIHALTRECLAILASQKLNSTDVIDVPSDQFILRSVPDHIRSDNVLRQEACAAKASRASERLVALERVTRAGSAVKKWSHP